MFRIKVPKIYSFEPFLWIYFIWYYLPFMRGVFHSSLYNYLFFSCYLIGCFLIALHLIIKTKTICLRSNAVYPILIYMMTMTIFVFFEMGDASEHIRVSFTFWGTFLIFYFLESYEDARGRLAKLLFVLFIITLVTSVIGVIINPRAARLLTFSLNAREEDIGLKLLNIADISFFQCLVICVPIILTFFYKGKRKIACGLGLILIFYSLIMASFTISLMIFFVALIMGIYINNNSSKKILLVIFFAILLIIIPWHSLFIYLSEIINNPTISERLLSISETISSRMIAGKLSSRFSLYMQSLNTFLSNPLGVGPEYSFIAMRNGIGYHSQILDDFARYGIFGVLFYFVFFNEYRKLIKNQWKKIQMANLATPIIFIYLLFLTFNPGFTSPYESVVMLFLIPMLPSIIRKKGDLNEYE